MSTKTTTQKTLAGASTGEELYQLTIETTQGDELHSFAVFSTIRELAHDGLESAVAEAI